MQRLASCSTLILVMFTGVIVTALLIGRAQPTPPRLAMLHLTDCELPCWIGIVPGVTTVEDAGEIIEKTFVGSYYDTDPKWSQAQGAVSLVISFGHISLTYDYTTGGATVGAIIFDFDEPRNLNYGDMITLLGSPDEIASLGGLDLGNTTMLIYKKSLIFNGYDDERTVSECYYPRWQEKVRLLQIANYPEFIPAWAVPWRGFRTCYR